MNVLRLKAYGGRPGIRAASRQPLAVSPSLCVARRILAPDIMSVWLKAPVVARRIAPGQFVQVRVTDSLEPFLRRPFSIAEKHQDRIRLVFRIVGRGTTALADSRVGDTWDILGPLGRPVRMPRSRNVILVGGGMGIAPLLFLARELASWNRVTLLLGARSRKDLILRSEFRALQSGSRHCTIRFATEDGSLGTKGLVTDLLATALHNSVKPRVNTGEHGRESVSSVLFACGPRPMLKRVKELTTGIEAYALWEERMGCGTGICYGCAVKSATGDGYIRFCQEGPTLDLKAIEL